MRLGSTDVEPRFGRSGPPPAWHGRIGAENEGALKGNKAHGRNECRSAGNGGCDTTDSSMEQGLEVGRSVSRSDEPRPLPLRWVEPAPRRLAASAARHPGGPPSGGTKGPRGLSGWTSPGGGSTSPGQGRHFGAGGGRGGSARAAHATLRRRGSCTRSMTWGSASADRSIIVSDGSSLTCRRPSSSERGKRQTPGGLGPSGSATGRWLRPGSGTGRRR
jgi:hypothetical protein